MSRKIAPIFSLISVLLGILFASSAIADNQLSGSSRGTNSKFHLNGILISGPKRSILVNNTLVREGDHVAGADILSIGQRGVRIKVGSHEQTVRVGFSGEWPQTLHTKTVTQPNSNAQFVSVKRGDTLSHIAERQLRGTANLHQMMIALYDANPQAFGGNINILREGAILRLPDDASLLKQTPETAVAEVVRQTIVWRNFDEQQTRLTALSKPANHIPVTPGTTPSRVSAHVPSAVTAINELRQTKPTLDSRIASHYVDAPEKTPVQSLAKVVQNISTWWYDAGQPLQFASVLSRVATTYLEQGNKMLPTQDHE